MKLAQRFKTCLALEHAFGSNLPSPSGHGSKSNPIGNNFQELPRTVGPRARISSSAFSSNPPFLMDRRQPLRNLNLLLPHTAIKFIQKCHRVSLHPQHALSSIPIHPIPGSHAFLCARTSTLKVSCRSEKGLICNRNGSISRRGNRSRMLPMATPMARTLKSILQNRRPLQ